MRTPPAAEPGASTEITGQEINETKSISSVRLPGDLEARLRLIEQRLDLLCVTACSPASCGCPERDR